MARLFITGYRRLARDDVGNVALCGEEPAEINATVEIGVHSYRSEALPEEVRFVRLHAEVACHVAFGAEPEATETNLRLADEQTEFFGVKKGLKIAVIEEGGL